MQGIIIIVQHEKNGWLFPPKSVVDLRNAILHVKNNPVIGRDVGTVGKTYVESTYALNLIMRKLEDALAFRAWSK